IDLQEPLEIDSMRLDDRSVSSFKRDGNVYHIDFGETHFINNAKPPLPRKYSLEIWYHGKPREAIMPPWDGGWIWSKDELGRPWMSVACQGLGASVWYPCKDHQSDEPDNGATLSVTVADSLVAVGNGRLKDTKKTKDGLAVWTWEVKNPINNYNIVPYIGKYVNWKDTLKEENGQTLDLGFWVLDYNLEKAKKHFNAQVKPMLKCFEYWCGPYPFHDDSYKLVEAPHLGMEHQSATAYGNHFVNGYYVGGDKGIDGSGTGWGSKFDYIIIHESGHEWFANNITTNDIADMWVHEGFANYMESLFVECQYGKKAANEYTQGERSGIRNSSPIIAPYGVNKEGSGDMYPKGANLVHTIRQIINDDDLFRDILRGLNKDFYHQTVDSKDVEEYISKKSKKDLSKVFDQYLRNSKLPQLEYKFKGDNMSYRWTNCIDGFNMPVRIIPSNEWLYPTTEWKQTTVTADIMDKGLQADPNFYIRVKKND
ncbi:MAG TPA: M1 family metallopeptidase, partial [Chitinophagaceae bacterium]|nr:M1 family metallopeptidase [Chitinophagaceae bacterium]